MQEPHRSHQAARAAMQAGILVSLLYGCHALRTGAPDIAQVCDGLEPGHPASPQTTPPPYEVISESLTYEANQVLQVELRRTGAGVIFKGFLIQARYDDPPPGLDNAKIGDFLPVSGTRTTCANNGGGSLTHSDNSDKSSITVNWQAPNQAVGAIRFRATFVQNSITHWVDVRSPAVSGVDLITGSNPPQPPVTSTQFISTPAVTLPSVDPIDLSSCGSDKSCYRHPPECSLDGSSDGACAYAITWSDTGDSVRFELVSSVTSDNQWVAIGLSRDTRMGDDSVVDCIHNAATSQITVSASWNEAGPSNLPLSNTSLGLVPGSAEGSIRDGLLLCRYSRFKTLTASLRETDKVFPLDTAYYLLLAKGSATGGFKLKHQTQPVVSGEQVFLNGTAWIDIGGSQTYPLIKAHGILMIFAWMVFASFSILMPRYMKTAWPSKLWRGKAIWFRLHQPLMAMAFLLTIVAFILIFVEVKGYSKLDGTTSAHPPMGIAVTALVIINPIMAIVRCGPDHPQRKIFNICHFLVGTLAHVLSAATIFIGLYMAKAQLPEWSRWVMCGYLGWHAAIEIILAVHMRCQQQGGEDVMEMKAVYSNRVDQMDSSKSSLDHSGSQARVVGNDSTPVHDQGSGFKTVVVVVHLLGVLAFATTLSVLIGRA